jgi:hypothetical protein
MFPSWQALLVAYAICFGIRQKCRFLDGLHPVLDNFLECPYCVGFHSGWMVWALVWVAEGNPPGGFVGAPLWALASAAFCLLLEYLADWLENGVLNA